MKSSMGETHFIQLQKEKSDLLFITQDTDMLEENLDIKKLTANSKAKSRKSDLLVVGEACVTRLFTTYLRL